MVNDPICEPIDDDEPQTVAASGFLQVLSQLLLLPLLLLLLQRPFWIASSKVYLGMKKSKGALGKKKYCY